MDPNRFDTLARRLGQRFSRRDAIRTGAGAALGAVALGSLRPTAAQDADTAVTDRFIAVRIYAYAIGTQEIARRGLQGLVGVMQQQPGFIDFELVHAGQSIMAISTFLDESTAVAAAKAEDDWIAANAAAILRGTPTILSGDVFLRSTLDTGCGCTTGVENACGADLVCCATSDLMGGPGVCLNQQTTCPAPPEPVASPTVETACTGAGCACNGGVQGACDNGLVCCQGDSTIPGGPGTCLTQADCTPPASPIPVCTSEGCGCSSGTENPCDDGLQCCGATMPGVCQTSC